MAVGRVAGAHKVAIWTGRADGLTDARAAGAASGRGGAPRSHGAPEAMFAKAEEAANREDCTDLANVASCKAGMTVEAATPGPLMSCVPTSGNPSPSSAH
jgi:hypothetical protein